MTISFSGWVEESIDHLQTENRSLVSRLSRPLYYIYVGALLTVSFRRPLGTHIYDKDWDTLIVLDACRTDALEAVADEYDFLDESELGSILSVGSTTFEWLSHTFTNDHIDEVTDTAYIGGNAYTDRVFGNDGETGHASIPFGPTHFDVVDPDDFAHLEELWRAELDTDSEWKFDIDGHTRRHPRYTTERAIDFARDEDPKRQIIHYMYPHDPFPLLDEPLAQPFNKLRRGELSKEYVWEAYLDNLRFVLDEVEILLENMDSEDVVITADHGEAFGEFGFYRHVIGCPLPCTRRVPWMRTTATDTESHESEMQHPEELTHDASVEDRLHDLGYL